MADRRRFVQARNIALLEREKGREELCRQIMAMPAERRWTIDPTIYGRLSPDQLRRVLADTAVDIALLGSPTVGGRPARSIGETRPRPYREPTALQRAWHRCGTGARAALVGMAGAMIANVGAAALAPAGTLIRSSPAISRDVNRWPPCPRLDRGVDACVYVVQDRLRWADASQILDLPIDVLRAPNRHLAPGDVLTRGAIMVVWRGRLRLE